MVEAAECIGDGGDGDAANGMLDRRAAAVLPEGETRVREHAIHKRVGVDVGRGALVQRGGVDEGVAAAGGGVGY